jgi:hypothetical protein
MDWVWKGILTSLLAAGIIGGGAFLLTWAKKKWPQNAEFIRYWLTSFTCLAIIVAIVFAAFGYTPFRKPAPLPAPPPKQVTQDNVEEYIKEWCDHLGLSVQRQSSPSQDFIFVYTIRTVSGDQIDVAQAKEKLGYLQLRTVFSLSPEHLQAVNKMSRREFIKFVNSVDLEQSRERDMTTSFSWNSDHGQVLTAAAVFISTPSIPIMNEGSFSASLDRVLTATGHMKAFVNLALETEPFNIPSSAAPSH